MIADLAPYAEYKDSGLPSVGAIPAHWDEKRAKCFFREVDERSTTGKEELLSVSHITGVTPRREKTVTMFLAKSNVGYKVCRPNDVAINTMWAWMAALGVVKQVGIVSPSYGVYRPLKGSSLSPNYVDHLLRTPAYTTEYLCRSTGVNTSRLRLYPEHFLRIPLICPPHDEQLTIVRFLDYANLRLERAIRAKRKVIALLNEQKQTIIHRAVTCGLDPNVPLKSSGIPWLGEIPAHWQVKRLKWVTQLQRGYDLPQEHRKRGTIPVVSSGGVIDTHCEARAQGPGVVMGRYGSTDAVFYIEQDFWPHNTSLFVTSFYDNFPKWCFYLLRTISKSDYSSKSAVPGVDRKDLYEIYVPQPPHDKQVEIVQGIEQHLQGFNAASIHTEREIALIREYRTRLIADVVTGKLDVREAARNLPVERAEAIETLVDTTELDGDEEIMDDAVPNGDEE